MVCQSQVGETHILTWLVAGGSVVDTQLAHHQSYDFLYHRVILAGLRPVARIVVVLDYGLGSCREVFRPDLYRQGVLGSGSYQEVAP